jgi:L-alanine-DL-glutamate epimerase-like enolase superfamily enzyme
MKDTIKQLKIYKAISQLSKPIADATHEISQIAFLVVEVELESGVTGQGYLLSFHYSPHAIGGALKDLERFVPGYAVYDMVKLQQDLAAETEYFGNNGLLKWAGATVNIAMWDAWGKTVGQPIWKMLGANGRAVPVYGSGGWISYSDAELLEEVRDYRARGFRGVKIKVGAAEEGRDLERLRRVREAVGNEIKIMMDANQGMDVASALKLAEEAAKINIHWFEEPIHHGNFAGYQLLRSKTGISLAMGEREYDLEALKQLIARNALDLWQPDIVRIGGVEAWRESAALAGAYQLPVLPHYYKDYDVPLLCTIPNGYGAESFDWIDGIIDNPMKIVDGMAYPRERPGWGFEFKKQFLEEIK